MDMLRCTSGVTAAKDRILGLLLGYSPEAIGQFEELTACRSGRVRANDEV
jgi:hypothetical protein